MQVQQLELQRQQQQQPQLLQNQHPVLPQQASATSIALHTQPPFLHGPRPSGNYTNFGLEFPVSAGHPEYGPIPNKAGGIAQADCTSFEGMDFVAQAEKAINPEYDVSAHELTALNASGGQNLSYKGATDSDYDDGHETFSPPTPSDVDSESVNGYSEAMHDGWSPPDSVAHGNTLLKRKAFMKALHDGG